MTESTTMAETLTEAELEIQARIYDVAHLARQLDLDEYIEKLSLYLADYDAQKEKPAPEEIMASARFSLRMAIGLREFQKTFPTDEEMSRLADGMAKFAVPNDIVEALAKGGN